jgi:hypothetical protein
VEPLLRNSITNGAHVLRRYCRLDTYLGALLGFILAFFSGAPWAFHLFHNAAEHSIRNFREEISWGRVTDKKSPRVLDQGKAR